MLEQELKLSVKGPFAPAFREGQGRVAGAEELPPQDLRATYYDTHDLRLARYGVTLRSRTGEGETPIWTVKLPAGDGVADGRDEVEFQGPASRVPEDAHALVRALIRSAALAPVARLRTRRRRWLLRDAGGAEVAELVDDRVSVLERGRVVERFREVEIEGRGIERPELERIAGSLMGNGVAPAEQTPKLMRALGPRATEPPDVPAPEPARRGDPAAVAVREAIAAGVRRLVMNEPRTRLGEVEPLHQMRVATRRLRSDLRTFRRLLDREWSEPLRDELEWLGDSLGAVRDLDVLLARLRRDAADLSPALDPLLAELEGRRTAARRALLQDLNGDRYLKLLDRLVDAVTAPRLSDRARTPGAKALPRSARRAWRKLVRPARGLGRDSASDEFHRVRVLTKRARYAAEAVAPGLPSGRRRRAERYAKRAAGVQDVLGELQDSAVAAETIGAFARKHPGDGRLHLAAGRLLEREAQAARTARAAFPAAWKRLDRKKRRAWL